MFYFYFSDVTLWEPVCPAGYRALGYVARASHSLRPEFDSIRCVHSDLVGIGSFSLIWADHGSGADDDVSVHQVSPMHF